jgi:formylglycine-generating enzyme required for sulfatase activity
MSRQEDIQALIATHKRRLQKLKEQQALRGVDTPPHVLIEIEDIEAELERLQTELDAGPPSRLPQTPAPRAEIDLEAPLAPMESAHLTYLDFELEIGPGQGREYPVAVLRSPAGEARETMHFPYDEIVLENRLLVLQNALLRSGGKRRQTLSPEEQAVRDFGRDLFNALFTGEVRGRYDVSLERAWHQDKGIRLKLRIQPPELAALPWEFLYDPRQAEYVCLSRVTPVVRYLELPRPMPPLSVRPPLRILGMIASPGDLEPLDVTREKGRVERALKEYQARGLVELTWLEGQTWRDLQRAMRRGPWHVFHFVGHGGFDRVADEGFIALADEEGETRRLNATQLGRLLADHRALRLALLNACEGARGGKRDVFSSTASILVRRGIPAVLAMQYAVTDRAAIEVARAFYEALADGMSVDGAVAEARKAVSLAVANTVEWGTPVLYMRSPDGLLFDIQAQEAREPGGKAREEARPSELATRREPEAEGPSRMVEKTSEVLGPFEPELILVPAGEFLMGSDPRKDKDAPRSEQPQHSLYLPDYHIARTPVTNAQYLAFVQATGHRQPRYWPGGKPPARKENHPVVLVSWEDAVAYCNWLAQKTGKAYRLPSEAEWEKAARGTDGRIYPWGDEWDYSRCNTLEDGPSYTTPVGHYSPRGDSPYGCADMAGNVREWCHTLRKPYPYDPRDGREDPGAEGSRVMRGGAFSDGQWFVRCAWRNGKPSGDENGNLGFRVCVAPR